MFTKKYYIHYKKGEKPKKHPFIEYILDRVNNHNENILLPIVGQTGSGKSYTALRLAELLDPNFSSKNIVFDSAKFMELLNSGDLGQGSVIIYDESGVGHDSKNFMTRQNKLFNYVMQTFRHMNVIVLFTTPNIGFMDRTTRLLFHGYVRLIDKNERAGKALAYAYLFKDDPRFGKVRDIKLRVTINGITKPIKQIIIQLPSKRLIEKYEIKKHKFSEELRKRIEIDLRALSYNPRAGSELTNRQQQIFNLKIKGLSVKEIANKLKITQGAVSHALVAAKKKGYDWQKMSRDLEELNKTNKYLYK